MSFSAANLTRIGGDSNGNLWMYTVQSDETDVIADIASIFEVNLILLGTTIVEPGKMLL